MIILMSILSAILYRLGGAKGFNTKFRDWGCPLVALITMLYLNINAAWWIHALSFLLMFGALTTYWDSIFGYDNFYAHGFMVGLAYLPYLLSVSWALLIIRAIILAILIGTWSKYTDNDIIEEMGRGFFIPLTLIIL